ncbi:hypothetical protein PhCBS80983_g05003 [Powellomyces hirtus]|uniref:Uncharacterized protein n=1 Tax=Powellomyces hirtus TaxID=109895 RepID=A0A507DWB2_9FUNG|nr:hypothetical protein PhCBS80983_g05003 [Powellomyces hirtus]
MSVPHNIDQTWSPYQSNVTNETEQGSDETIHDIHHPPLSHKAQHNEASPFVTNREHDYGDEKDSYYDFENGSYNDPDALLDEVADESWSQIAPRHTWFQKCKQWYKPVYDYKTPGLTATQRRQPRFCNGRFRSWQFVLIHAVIFGLFATIILAPLIYFVVVPKIIQSKIDGIDASRLALTRLDVVLWNPNGLRFGFATAIPAQLFLPLHVTLGAMTAQIGDKDDFGKGWAEAQIPEIAVKISQEMKVDLEGDLVVKNVRDLFQKLSSKGGMQRLTLRAKFGATINVWGIKFYKNLPLHKDIIMPTIAPTVESLYGALPSAMKAKNLNQQIRRQFLTQDLLTFPNSTLPDIAIEEIGITMTDTAISLLVGVTFENPTIVQVKVPTMTAGISVQNSTVAYVSIRDAGLKTGINAMKMGIDVQFIPSEGEAMGKVIGGMMNFLMGIDAGEELYPAVRGPVNMTGVDFVADATRPLVLGLPVQAALEAFHVDKLKGLISLSGVETLLSTTKFSASVSSTQIGASVSLALPRLIPLPPIDFNYTTSLSVEGAMNVFVQPIRIVTGAENMTLMTRAIVVPINSDQAASDLANAINPILGAQPEKSAIKITDLSFSEPSTSVSASVDTARFTSLKTTVLPVPLPEMCVKCIISAVTKNGTSLPIALRDMNVNQLTDVSGFGADGQIGIKYPMGLARLDMNLGYVGLGVNVGAAQIPLINLQLPTGLNFTPDAANETVVNVGARMIIERDLRIPAAMQTFIDGFLADTAPMDMSTSIMVSGILFGESPVSHFTTFSKIAVSIDAHDFKDIAMTIGKAVIEEVFREKLVILKDVGLDVVTPIQVNVGVKADVRNPVPIGLNLGSVALAVGLDDMPLSSIAVSPITMAKGTSGLALAVVADLATGANGMANKIAILVDDMVDDVIPAAILTISGFAMTPTGNGSAAAVIDQFSTLKINIPPTLLHLLNPLGADSPIDLSAMFGDRTNILDGFDVALSSAGVSTGSQATLAVAAGLSITNPLPVSARIPYAEITMELNLLDFVVIEVFDIALAASGTGQMAPSLNIRFLGTDGIQDQVAAFVSTFIDGKIMDGVAVKTIFFGTGALSRNDLLSAVRIDATKITQGIDTSALVSGIVGMVLGKDISFPMNLAEIMHMVSVVIEGTLRVETLPNRVISANMAGMKAALPFTLDADLGMLGFAVTVSDANLMSVALLGGVQIAASQIGTMRPVVSFVDQEPAQNRMAEIGRWIFDSIETDATFDIGRLGIGLSPSDRITSFDKIKLSIPVSRILKPQGDLSPLLAVFAPSLTKVDIATVPGNAMSLAAGIAMKSPIQIAATIGWVGVHVEIDDNPLVDVGLPNLAIDASDGATNLNIATTLAFKDTDATRTAVAKLVDGVMEGGDSAEGIVSINKLALGASETDIITAFSKIKIPLRASSLLNTFGVKTPIDYAQVKGFLSLAVLRAGMDVRSGKSVALDASANIGIIPFPTTINIGHVGISVNVNDNPLVDVTMPEGIHVNAATTGIKADVAFTDNSRTQYALADIVDGLLNGPKVGGSIGVTGLQMGHSAQDRITLLDKVRVRVDMDALCSGLGIAVPMDITQLLGSTNPSVGTLHLKTLPRQTMSITASADLTLPLPFPVDLRVGYVFAGASLGSRRDDMHPLADFSLANGLALRNSGFSANMVASLVFTDQDATRNAVANIVDGLFQSGIKDGWVGVSGIDIGASPLDLITAFSKVNINLSIVRLLEQLHVPSPLDINSIAGSLSATLGKLEVATAPAASLDVTTTLGFTLPLPFAITFETSFFNARAMAGGVPLAALEIPGLSLSAGHGGRSDLALKLRLKFLESDRAETEIARIVDNVLHRNQADAIVGADGILFGASDSPDDWIRILSKAQVALPIDSVLPSFGLALPLDLTRLPSALNTTIDSPVQLKTLPGAQMSVKTAASFKLPFEVALKMGYVGVRVNVNGVGLVTVALPGLVADSKDARSSLSIDTNVRFESNSAVQRELAKVVEEILAGKVSSEVGIDRLVFGVSESDVINTMSKANIALPVSAFYNPTGPLDLGALAASYVREALLGSPTSNSTGLTIKRASLAAEAGDKLHVTADAFVPLPLPFAVDLEIGYAGLRSIAVDSVQVMTADVNGVAYSGGDIALDITVNVEDNGDVRAVLRKVTQGDGKGGFSGILGFGGLVFGASKTDVVEAFDLIAIQVPISPIGQVIAEYVTHFLDSFLAGVPAGAIQSGITDGVQIRFSPNASLAVTHLGVEFQPANLIACAVDGSLQFPFDLSASLPFLDVAIGLDEVPVVQVGITGLDIAGGDNILKLGTNVILRDGEAVQNKVAAVAKAIFQTDAQLPGEISISGLRLGVSSADSIDAFSEMVFSLSLDKIVGPFIKSPPPTQGPPDSIPPIVSGMKLDRIGIRAAEGRTLAIDVSADFQSNLPITLKGLGYVSVNAGVDAVDLMTVNIPGILLQKGDNSMDMRLNIAFLQSGTVQNEIAKFLGNAYTLGWGNTPEAFALANLRFGYSQDDHISTLSKARIGFSSAKVLSATNVDYILSLIGMSRADFTTATLFPRIDIQGAQIRFDNRDRFEIVGRAALQGFAVDASIAFPYLAARIGLNGAHFATAEMKELSVKQEGDNTLMTTFTMALDFPRGDLGDIQKAVGDVVSDMQSPSGIVRGALEMIGLEFGVSKDDAIDALGTCRGELAMQSIGTIATKFFNDLLRTVELDLIDVAPKDARSIDADVIAHYTPVLPNIVAAIPYIFLEINLDGNKLIEATATDIHVAGSGQVLAKADVGFNQANKAGAQTLATIAGNMIFRTRQTVTNTLTITGLRFGRTKEAAVQVVAGTTITFDLPWFVGVVTDYVNQPENMLNILDLHAVAVPEGLVVKGTFTKLPPAAPFRSRPGASATAHVVFDGSNAVQLSVSKVDLQPGKNVELDMMIYVIEPTIIACADVLLPQLLQWESFTQSVTIGRLGLTMGDPKSASVQFTMFDHVEIKPPPLYMFDPLMISPRLINPLTKGLGLDIHIGIPNGGPLAVDLGVIGARIVDRGTTEFGSVTLVDGLVLKNAAEGGRDPRVNDINVAARFQLDPNPLRLWNAMIDLIRGGRNFDIDFFAHTKSGTPIPWLERILESIPEYLKGNLVPIVFSLLEHIKIKLGPFTLGPPPLFKQLAREVLSKLPQNHILFTDGEMPAGFLPANDTFLMSTTTLTSRPTSIATPNSIPVMTTTLPAPTPPVIRPVVSSSTPRPVVLTPTPAQRRMPNASPTSVANLGPAA